MHASLKKPVAGGLLLAALLPAAARAQTVYKCTLDGKISYGQAPCPAGASSAVLELPPAPAAKGAEGAEGARGAGAADLKRQKTQAAALEKARHQREDRDAKELDRAALAADARQKKCGKLRLTKKWADDDVRRAPFDKVDAARIKAKRAADTLALECPK